jgi:plastocyanin
MKFCTESHSTEKPHNKEVQDMKKWSIPVIVAIVALLMPASSTMVNAQDEAGLSISKSADPTSATVGDTITYTYTITNNGDITISDISLEDDKLGPISDNITLAPGGNVTATATYTVSEGDLEQGSIVNNATATGTDPDGNTVTANDTATVELTSPPPDEVPAIEVTKSADKTAASAGDNITYTYVVTNTGNVTANNVTLEDDKLGELMSGVTLLPGESVTTTATYEIKTSDFWKFKPITNIATVTATGPDGEPISATSEQVSVVPNRIGMCKAMILWLRGVPGKGIKKAPGLQKPFNPKSRAAEHAGKKDKPKMLEQLRIRERVENQGTEQHLQIQSEVENQNQAGSGEGTQDNDKASPGKGQLKKFSGADNQTQAQQATQGNGHKPDKDKPNNKSKQGK